MKLLLYSHFFAPSIGGVETIVQSLASGLSELASPGGAKQFEVVLATQTPAADFNDATLPFRVVRQPSRSQLWQLIRSSDVIHLAGPALAPLILSFLARKPVVIEHHGYQSVCPNGLLVHRPDGSVCPGHFLAREYGECLRCVANETSTSRSWLTLLSMFPRFFFTRRATANVVLSNHFLKRCSLPRSSVVYHGIEDPLPAGPRDSIASDQPRLCFAYVGRLVSEKGLAVLLEATRLLRDEGFSFEVRLIGDGPERSQLQNIIACDHLGACVHITGFLTGAAYTQSLADVSVVVMPSVWEETAGLAAIEQMMRGRLVIASDIGGLGEVIGDSGLKFPAGDGQALASAMRTVLQQPSILNSLGESARSRAVTLFSRNRMIKEHARIYRQACESD